MVTVAALRKMDFGMVGGSGALIGMFVLLTTIAGSFNVLCAGDRPAQRGKQSTATLRRQARPSSALLPPSPELPRRPTDLHFGAARVSSGAETTRPRKSAGVEIEDR
jgi:hypothetical protein